MLRESELRALAELREPMAVSELAERLDRSQSRASEVVSVLEQKGLGKKEREGKSKRVAPTESKAVELYRDLTQRWAHVDWPALLSGPTIPLLCSLDEPVTVADLADRTDNYRNTVHRRVNYPTLIRSGSCDPLARRGWGLSVDTHLWRVNSPADVSVPDIKAS